MFLSVTDTFHFCEKKIVTCLLILALEAFLEGTNASTAKAKIEEHLNLGKLKLDKGLLSEALTHYHDAVDGDPENYLTYYKRATVYVALGHARMATADFTKALELKPDFTVARLQRALVYLKTANYDLAEKDFNDVNTEEAHSHLRLIVSAKKQWDLIQKLYSSKQYENVIKLLTELIDISPWSSEMRKLRANSYIKINDIQSAIIDLRSVNKLRQDNTEGHYELANILYNFGNVAESLNEIRECARNDPDNKKYLDLHKKIRKIDKSITNAEKSINNKEYNDCINSGKSVLQIEKHQIEIIAIAKKLLCKCYAKSGNFSPAIDVCSEAFRIKEEPSILCDRAEAYLIEEMFSEARNDYQKAKNIQNDLECANEGLNRVKKLEKQAGKRDYYKILGVKRTASNREIVKAYRIAAKKWHPDNFQGDEKKLAEKKFIDIAAAKEVLTDPEKRQKYDNGQDPLDPESEQFGFQGNPFQGFHHGQPFQFKFHFN